jgi:hypothetical protein
VIWLTLEANQLRGWQGFVGPHHFVVLMFQDVAVPDVAAGEALKGDKNACNHARVGADGVFPPALEGLGRLPGPGEAQRSLGLEVDAIEAAAIENLKADEVQMNGDRSGRWNRS